MLLRLYFMRSVHTSIGNSHIHALMQYYTCNAVCPMCMNVLLINIPRMYGYDRKWHFVKSVRIILRTSVHRSV